MTTTLDWLPNVWAAALDYPQTIAESPVLADIVDREIGA